jgi:hypothetical protein
MSTLFPKTISYKAVTGSYVSGIWVKSEATGTFEGSVQPVTGKDLETLPTGRGDRGIVKVYSGTQLNVSRADTDNSGDIVIWEGKEWEIIQELPYQNDLIEHYKYFAEFRKVST